MSAVAPVASQVVELGFGKRRGLGQHTLGGVGTRSRIESTAAHLSGRNPQLASEVDDVFEDRSRFLLGRKPQLANPASTSEQQLAYRVATLDLLTAKPSRRGLAWSRRGRTAPGTCWDALTSPSSARRWDTFDPAARTTAPTPFTGPFSGPFAGSLPRALGGSSCGARRCRARRRSALLPR